MSNQDFLINLCSNQQQPLYLIALIGLAGVILGALITVVGNLIIELFKTSNARKADKLRQKLLKDMLQAESFQWRSLRVLSSVIGCNEEQTKLHLIAVGARGSEENDGNWGLISRNPLPAHVN